jgi:hypothetical protein
MKSMFAGLGAAVVLAAGALAQEAVEGEPGPAEIRAGQQIALQEACAATDPKPESCGCQTAAILDGMKPELVDAFIAVAAARKMSAGQAQDAQAQALRDALSPLGLKPDNLGELQQGMLAIKDKLGACRG